MEKEDPFLRTSEPESVEVSPGLPDDLIEELDQALETIEFEPAFEAVEPVAGEMVTDGFSEDVGIREMQLTFVDLARNSLNPVARYMKAMSLGEGGKDLLEISELVVTPLIPKVEAVGLNEHAEDLAFFRSLLLLALGERDPSGSHAIKEVVMEGFRKIDERFGLGIRGYRLAVKNVVEFYRALKNSDSVDEADIRRFFAIGVPSLTWVRRTKVGEMSSLSGISVDVMTQIRKLAAEYRQAPRADGAMLARNDTVPLRKVPGFAEDVAFTNVEDASVLDVEHVGSDGFRGSA